MVFMFLKIDISAPPQLLQFKSYKKSPVRFVLSVIIYIFFFFDVPAVL